jgi:hypothetical protein
MLYAAYGSNLHPVRFARRLPDSRFRGTGTVAGRKLRFDKRSQDESGKCHIATGTGPIHVAVYELNGDERTELDRIEGLGLGYASETIDVPGFSECFTYKASRSHIDEDLQPYTWYKELVLVGCEYHGFPADYIATIRSTAAIADPDAERHAMNMRIVELARQAP